MTRRRPLIRSQATAVLLGAALLVGGWACWYDAWDGRGRPVPRVLRPITWW